jgi:NitT/TauT family transport system substrate-binding protein
LKIGSLLTIGLAPVLVAQARGYFAREGLTVEIVNYTNGAEIVPSLAAGQIDAGLSVAPSAGLLNALARGLEVKVVASNGTIKPHRNIGNIIVRKNLAPASGFLDLKTLTPPIRAAATVEGILPHAIILLEAEKAGFKLSDVSMSFLGLPDMNAALQNNQLDIAASGEPLITIAEQQGIAARWREMADDFPDVPYSTMVYGPNLLTKDPSAGVRLMRAYLQGARDYEDAFTRDRDHDAIVGILTDPLRTPVALFKAIQDGGGLAYIDPNGEVNVQTLQPVLDLWVRTGLVQPGFDLATLVDPRPAQQAVGSMPRYP